MPGSNISMGLHNLDMPTGDWEAWVAGRVRRSITAAGEIVTTLTSAPGGDPTILELWNDAGVELANAMAVCSLMSSVHPEPGVVKLSEDLEAEGQRFITDLMLDADVFGKLRSLGQDDFDEAGRRVLDEALRDYRRSGVDRDEPTRARLREMQEQETGLGQAFARNIRDGRLVTSLSADSLAGLPVDYVDDHPAGPDGLVEISTDYTDTNPFLEFALDAGARRAVVTTFLNLGWPANDEVLRTLLALRHERATLLGYPDWPTYDAEEKMIGTGAAIAEFIDQVAADARPAAEREIAELTELTGEPLDVSNWRYVVHLMKATRFDVNAEEVRSYFDFTRVRQGLLDVTGRLFGLEYQQVQVPTWHQDVTSYDVLLDDLVLGRIHLDLHPREGKYNHAAQFDLVSGVLGRQLPEGVLVCNFSRGLMDHDDVVTLFHEFGHLLHHTLAGRHRWVSFSGVATEWDFVEAPSQLLEEWAWDASVLQTFARNAAGETIPTDLVARMRRAEDFGKAFLARTQLFYAAVSYRFHLERPEDLTARLLSLQAEYSLIAPLPGTHFHTGFGHLEGYTSAYYTYMWSLVIAKDLHSAFAAGDPFEAEVARRYRDQILAAGGSKDAADLIEDFLGRPYDTRAFRAWLSR